MVLCIAWSRCMHRSLHYTTLQYTTLHYTTLHYTTLHYTTLHYTTLHYTTLLAACCIILTFLIFKLFCPLLTLTHIIDKNKTIASALKIERESRSRYPDSAAVEKAKSDLAVFRARIEALEEEKRTYDKYCAAVLLTVGVNICPP
jgi:hypothetical protein